MNKFRKKYKNIILFINFYSKEKLYYNKINKYK